MKKITFATNPGAGSLEYIKLLVKSLQYNLDYKEHEILVFVDRDTDGIVDYLRSIKKNFHDLKIITHKINPVISYQRNSSLIVDLAKYNIISYLHSDMVVSKGYDTAVLSELEENTILSSTRIEPPLHPESPITFTKNFGLSPEEFRFDEFNSFADTVKSNNHINYFFAPYTFHKDTWNKLGGYDTLFRRSREDSDLVQRCLHAGVKLKQTYAANVYHFTCVASRGKDWFNRSNHMAQQRVELQNKADEIELQRFCKKWGKFSHGEEKLHKFDSDLVLSGKNPKDVFNAAIAYWPFFERVWVNDDKLREELVRRYEAQHEPANQLLSFSTEDWLTSMPYYNKINHSNVFMVGEPSEYNVLFRMDLDSSKDKFHVEDLYNVYEFCNLEPGDYEYKNCVVTVNIAKEITPHYKVDNPPFDMSLLNME